MLSTNHQDTLVGVIANETVKKGCRLIHLGLRPLIRDKNKGKRTKLHKIVKNCESDFQYGFKKETRLPLFFRSQHMPTQLIRYQARELSVCVSLMLDYSK
jgi:hypothetical protein